MQCARGQKIRNVSTIANFVGIFSEHLLFDFAHRRLFLFFISRLLFLVIIHFYRWDTEFSKLSLPRMYEKDRKEPLFFLRFWYSACFDSRWSLCFRNEFGDVFVFCFSLRCPEDIHRLNENEWCTVPSRWHIKRKAVRLCSFEIYYVEAISTEVLNFRRCVLSSFQSAHFSFFCLLPVYTLYIKVQY